MNTHNYTIKAEQAQHGANTAQLGYTPVANTHRNDDFFQSIKRGVSDRKITTSINRHDFPDSSISCHDFPDNATPLQMAGKQYQGIEENATPNATAKRNHLLKPRVCRLRLRRPFANSTHTRKGEFSESIKRIVFSVHKKEFLESIKGYFREQTRVLFGAVRTRTENLLKPVIQNLTKPNIEKLPKALLNGVPRFKSGCLKHSTELKNSLTSGNHQGYYEDLSKTISGLSNRYKLAFFVPKFYIASQAIKRLSTKHLTQYSMLQGKTVISMVSNLPPSYNGLTLQNIKAFWRICRAVTNSTESKTRYPIFFHSVALTQKLLGGHYHD